jgi:phosphate transport system substrate-binding protein
MQSLGQAYQARAANIMVIVDTMDPAVFDLMFAHDETEGRRSVPIALDALAIVVHPGNPVRELTLLDVQGIFAGRGYDWEPFGGGQPGRVNVLDQQDGTPSQRFFAQHVMKSLRVTPNAILVPSDSAAVRRVASDPLAIGYASIGYLDSGVAPLVIESISPVPRNLEEGCYHLLRPVYIEIADQPSREAQSFLDFVLSGEGQAVLSERYGRVNITRVP